MGKGKSPEVGCFEFIVWLTRHGTMHAARCARCARAPLHLRLQKTENAAGAESDFPIHGLRWLGNAFFRHRLADTTTKTQTFLILFQ